MIYDPLQHRLMFDTYKDDILGIIIELLTYPLKIAYSMTFYLHGKI